MWRRRTVDDVSTVKQGSAASHPPPGMQTKSASMDDYRRVEPYRSLPLSTIPERENSIASNHRVSEVPTASSIYTASPEFGYTFDSPDAPAPLFSPVREPESFLPSPEPEKPGHSARRSSLPVPRKALPAGSKIPVKKLVASYNDKDASVKAEPSLVSPSQPGMSFAERAARAGFSGLSIDIGGNNGQKARSGTSGHIPVLEPAGSTPISNSPPNASADKESTRTITPTISTQPPAASSVPYTSDLPDAYAFQFVVDAYDDDEIKPTVPLKAGDKSASSSVQKLPSPPVSPLTGSNPNSPVTHSSSAGDLHRSVSVVSAMTDYGRRVSLDPQPAVPAIPAAHATTTSRVAAQTPQTPPAQATTPKAAIDPKRESTTSWTSWEIGDDQMRTPHAQAGSRFSWTTFATSTPPRHARTESADDSSIGRSPTASLSSNSNPDPIILRKRPISTFGVYPSAGIKRKPTPSITSSLAGENPPPADTPMALPISLRTSKKLPLSPPELESVDLVTNLQAQLDDLAYRRRNLGKVIESLTQLQPQNPVIQDLSKRRETASKVALFEAQLAEVQRQEYDLGIRLCRAWKRRDQEAPTTLWIRRVTS